ncbi:MAG: hypothetical protein QME66_08290 [Candidatus Eisenbacteria bacterium]|nr:hypothetical protein [Candidatus Eisenbacteria bacterium]
MADIEPTKSEEGKGPPVEEPKEEVTAKGPDPMAEVTELKTKLAASEAALREVKEGVHREIDTLKLAMPREKGRTLQQIQEEVDESFNKEGACAGMTAWATNILDPIFSKIIGARDEKINNLLSHMGKKERMEVMRDERCTAEVLSRIDTVMEKLTLDQRAEPGAYIATFEEIIEAEENAERKMQAEAQAPTVHSRKRQVEPEEDEDGALNEDEAAFAKRDGLDAKTYRRYGPDRVANI